MSQSYTILTHYQLVRRSARITLFCDYCVIRRIRFSLAILHHYLHPFQRQGSVMKIFFKWPRESDQAHACNGFALSKYIDSCEIQHKLSIHKINTKLQTLASTATHRISFSHVRHNSCYSMHFYSTS